MKDIRQFAMDILAKRYGQADRIKVSRKFYEEDIRGCVLTGRSEALEFLLHKHEAEPFGTVDEVMGEIQILLANNWNEFHRLFPTRTAPTTVERILKQLGHWKVDPVKDIR